LPPLVRRAQALARQTGFALTAEIGEQLASSTRELFAADPRVEVGTGDALRVMPGRGPSDLLFADSGVRDAATRFAAAGRRHQARVLQRRAPAGLD
jgi:hypothetical protein